MNYYDEIKHRIINDEIYSRAKDYLKERHRVITYYEIGQLLAEAGSKYGEDIIGSYSEKLVLEIGKKYNRRLLFRMRQFYLTFSNEKVSTMWTQLSWSHIRLLFGLDIDSINYYIQTAADNSISVRELDARIKTNEFERLPKDTKIKLTKKEKVDAMSFIKNPIIIKNNSFNTISEKLLQKLIVEDIEFFMKELGGSFSFIGSEFKIKIGSAYNYIDLLLYNYVFNCFVVVELKVTELKKEHIGQIQTYMNYIDEHLRKGGQEKTIGIIVCRQDNEYIIRYCSDDRIVSREYKIVRKLV